MKQLRAEFWKGSGGLFIGCWAGFLLFYWWLVSKLEGQQMVAAALAGLGAAVAMLALRKGAGVSFRVKAGWFGVLLWRLPWKVLRDLGLLAAELWRVCRQRRHPTGTFKDLPFTTGPAGPEAAGRRALVMAGISTPPNTIAISVDQKQGSILVHQLVFRSETPADGEWPL